METNTSNITSDAAMTQSPATPHQQIIDQSKRLDAVMGELEKSIASMRAATSAPAIMALNHAISGLRIMAGADLKTEEALQFRIAALVILRKIETALSTGQPPNGESVVAEVMNMLKKEAESQRRAAELLAAQKAARAPEQAPEEAPEEGIEQLAAAPVSGPPM